MDAGIEDGGLIALLKSMSQAHRASSVHVRWQSESRKSLHGKGSMCDVAECKWFRVVAVRV